jgi:hypothetical protein
LICNEAREKGHEKVKNAQKAIKDEGDPISLCDISEKERELH